MNALDPMASYDDLYPDESEESRVIGPPSTALAPSGGSGGNDFEPPTTAGLGDDESSWQPIDLRAVLDGDGPAAPSVLSRSDGRRLLYPGRVHWFQGPPESCKTWLAYAAAVQVVRDHGEVLIIDFEDDETSFVHRFRTLGVRDEDLLTHVTYIRPDERLFARDGQPTPGGLALDAVLRGTFRLAVIDGVTDGFAVEGLNILDNVDAAQWMRRLPKRIAATGAAVICVDHVVKNAGARGRYALGAQHKLAGVDGAVYGLSVIDSPRRAEGDFPVSGVVAVTVEKDRCGHVRSFAGGEVATLTLTSFPGGSLEITLDPPHQPTAADDSELRRSILDFVSANEGASKRDIERAVSGKGEAIRAALSALTEAGQVRVERVGGAHRHFINDGGPIATSDA